MDTIEANFTDETTLLIQGAKGKLDKNGKIINETITIELLKLVESFKVLMEGAENK